MAFGKRSAGDLPPRRPVEDAAFDTGAALDVDPGAVRTVVVNKGAGIDKGFIGLAVGVVLLAGGGAVAAPALFSMMGGGVKPIAEVIAGLDYNGVRQAMAQQAFPDEDGRAFMATLAANFPLSHERLVGQLTDSAMAGGDRDTLFKVFNAWSMDFALSQKDAVARTGAEGYDKATAALGEGLRFLDAESGGCSVSALRNYTQRPTLFVDLTKYDTRAYHFNMHVARDFVDLAAKGKNARPVDTKLTANDMNAMQATFVSLMGDPQIMSLVQMAAMSGGNSQDFQAAAVDKLNVCQLGRSILIKFEGLPAGTKARLFGSLLSGDITNGFDMNALGSRFGNPMGGSLSFRP